MKYMLLLFTGLALIGCQVVSETSDNSLPSTESRIYDNTSTFAFEGRNSHAWVSETFSGDLRRQIKDGVLVVTADQTSENGGLDVGLSAPELNYGPVSKVADGASICSAFKIELQGPGRWWAGPKISVNWQGDEAAKQNGDDWYENYIIETASTSPEYLHDLLTGPYFKAEVLPDRVWAGSPYRSYKIRFNSWWQFWSVRQDYREAATVPLKPILTLWAENGLPTDRRYDGVKANLETYGKLSGSARLAVDVTNDPKQTLDCAL